MDNDFPNLTTEVLKVDANDARLNSALWRDFTILGATYLLEPCHLNFLKTKNYGRGMSYLPEKLALPMKILADRLHYKQPILDYAQAYSLNNWKLRNDPNPEDPNYHNDQIVNDMDDVLKNFDPIRRFHGGEDERGFILLHAAIVSKTHKQVQAFDKIYEGIPNQDRELVNKGLEETVSFLEEANEIFNKMWIVSSPQMYLQFRTFIMGIKGNEDIFPEGVVFKGVEDYQGKPQFFRGETGAQDSIIPAMDSALGLDYPRNSLTEYLFELRDYRPFHHQEYINQLKRQSVQHNFREYVT